MTMDDPFDDIVAGLEIDTNEATVVNVRDLSDADLSQEFNKTRDKLLHMGEMRHPKTPEARELHSYRSALLIEMNRRKWK